MAVTKYTRNYDFEDFQSTAPTTPLPADELEGELNEIKTVSDATIDSLALIQRDDGQLKNGAVHTDAFSAAALALMGGSWTPKGAWATATAYVVGDVVENSDKAYVCAVAHTSGTFSTDDTAGYWIGLGGDALLTAYSNTASGLDAATVQAALDELALMSGAFLSKSVAGSSDVTLTAGEADNAIIECTGALTGNINVIVPTEERRWIVHNNTSGAFTLTVKTSAGTGIAVTQGKKAWLYGDGTNVVKFIATDDHLGANTFTGIQTFGAQTRWTKGSDIASASPLVLGTDGNYFDVTGTTGFSTITVAAGTLFMLQFDGALLLTHGASLDLPFGVNQTTQAGDEALCYATAANTVRVLSYKHATAAAARTALGAEAADADILKADTSDTLTVGFDATEDDAGTKSTGTFTPDPADGNFQKAVNGGAHTLAPPAKTCSIVIQYTNNASAGAITTSGFTLVDGDTISTTNGDDFHFFITEINGFSHLHVKALQ